MTARSIPVCHGAKVLSVLTRHKCEHPFQLGKAQVIREDGVC